MLLDFTVENFRSIKGAETLSAVAATKSTSKSSNSESHRRVKSDDEIAEPFQVEGWDIDVLPVIAIFGANASGKSNVLKAFDYLLNFMVAGNYYRESELIPFKLDKQIRESPTHFKLSTIFNGTIYTYTLALNNTQIFSEKLEYALASTKRTRLLFSRIWDDEDKRYHWKNGSDFLGAHTQLEKNLQEHEPFTSLFPRLDIQIVKPLVAWLTISCVGVNWQKQTFNNPFINSMWRSQSTFLGFSDLLEKAKNLLCKFDTGLYGIEIRAAKDNEQDCKIFALHKTEDGEIISWEFEEESLGTQHLFNLSHNIQTIFVSGCLLLSDELGSNIHPNIMHEVVRIFQNSTTNPNRAQIIFTSHDNTLQRNNLLRRDQIWFTQKRPDQSTELYSLSDFKVRNDLAIDKAYLDGRFGAVPFISDEDDFSPVGEDNG